MRPLQYCGEHSNIPGFVDGPLWHFLHGSNFLFGTIDKDLGIKNLNNFTTDNGAYISQDLRESYKGQFSNGKMKSAQLSEIDRLQFQYGIPIPIFSQSQGKIFKHFASENGKLQDALTEDPLEKRYVYVNQSRLPDAGQGLFAKVDIAPDTIFAFFGGFVYTAQEWNNTNLLYPKYFGYFQDASVDYFVHIPDEAGDDLNKYRATLGHKINHGFKDHNCRFVANNHPRFGLIAAAKTKVNVQAGQELVCHYNMHFHVGQPWYQEKWRTEVDEDTPEGPFGHRESKKESGLKIQPMLTDVDLYKEFYAYATTTLKLDNMT